MALWVYSVCIVQAQPYVWLGQKVMAVVAQEQQMALRSVQNAAHISHQAFCL